MERPILFSAPMVQAILSGAKTQTRRVMKPQPTLFGKTGYCGGVKTFNWEHPTWKQQHTEDGMISLCPYGKPGDSLWVRETFFAVEYPRKPLFNPDKAIETPNGWAHIHYRADEAKPGTGWKPSIFMPRWASRITLEICSVRVERLQEISEADAVAEGIEKTCTYCYGLEPPVCGMRGGYARLWDEINEKRGYPFSSNPFVWVIEFRRMTP